LIASDVLFHLFSSIGTALFCRSGADLPKRSSLLGGPDFKIFIGEDLAFMLAVFYGMKFSQVYFSFR